MDMNEKGRMRAKTLIKATLGRTPVWPYVLKARFYASRYLDGGVALLERVLNRVAVRFVSPEKVKDLLNSRDFYGKKYFDSEKSPFQESGYAEAYDENPDFQEVARLARDLLGARRALDVGCAKGFLVQALLRAGVDAWGTDISEYAIGQAPPEVRERLWQADLVNADLPEDEYDLVLALEVLEHIPPGEIAAAVANLRRCTSRYIWATIPSYGPNPYGLDGWLEGKILPRKMRLYREHLIDLAELHHMTYDIRGLPIHGHLIAASFDWWTALFTSLGFVRRGDLERVINRELRSAREGIWDCFLLEKVRPAPASTSVELESGDFRQNTGGAWACTGILLPAGIYRATVRVRLDGNLEGKRKNERVLTLACLSEDGERIYGMRLPTRREVESKACDRSLELDWIISSDGMGPVTFRLDPTPGIRLDPIGASIVPGGQDP